MRTILLIAAVALAAAQLPAQAQTLVPKQVELGDFGACLLKQAPAQSAKLLRAALNSPEERDAAKTLAMGHDSCVHGAVVSGRTGAIHGAVAQQALFRDPSLLTALSALPAGSPARPPMADGRRFLIEYAQCLVATDPQHTAAFLSTPFSSVQEQDGFLAYGETLKSCMPIGQQYHVDIPDLRNQIAAIAWQAVNATETK